METVYGILGGSVILALAVIIIVLIFKDPIRRRIESGSSFESSFGPRGARLVLGPSEASKEVASSTTTQDSPSSGSLPIDAKLIHVVPPLEPDRFMTIELPHHQPPQFYHHSYAPTGLIIIHQVPFFLRPVVDEAEKPIGHQAIDIKPSGDNVAAIEEVPVHVQDVSLVHLLLSAGHGFASRDGVQLLGKRIGYFEFVFSDGTNSKTDLVLGKNIREWAFAKYADLVRQVDYNLTKPAWIAHDNAHRIDYMKVALPEAPKTLEVVRVVAKFEDEHPNKSLVHPAILISAITCERAR